MGITANIQAEADHKHPCKAPSKACKFWVQLQSSLGRQRDEEARENILFILLDEINHEPITRLPY